MEVENDLENDRELLLIDIFFLSINSAHLNFKKSFMDTESRKDEESNQWLM